jgi:hypothetical protein
MNMNVLGVIGPIMALCLVWAGADAADEDPGPSAERTAEAAHREHGGHAGHGARTLRLELPDGAKAVLWKPDLERQTLEVGNGTVEFPRTGVGNYHAIVAEWEGDAGKGTLISYKEVRGKPSGQSPRELLAADKTELEIVPDPLPREHYRYHTAESWGFRLRFQGKPLADTRVVLHTENGSRLEADSDAQGYLDFKLPDDFPEVLPGRDSNPPGEFRLGVAHESEGRRYQSVLVALYHPNPRHWRSFGGGLGVLMLGLAAGFVVARRRVGGSEK